MKTFKELLKEGTQILINGGIEEARLDAWLLLEYTAGITRAWYYAHDDQKPEQEIADRYRELCTRRAKRILQVRHILWAMNLMWTNGC